MSIEALPNVHTRTPDLGEHKSPGPQQTNRLRGCKGVVTHVITPATEPSLITALQSQKGPKRIVLQDFISLPDDLIKKIGMIDNVRTLVFPNLRERHSWNGLPLKHATELDFSKYTDLFQLYSVSELMKNIQSAENLQVFKCPQYRERHFGEGLPPLKSVIGEAFSKSSFLFPLHTRRSVELVNNLAINYPGLRELSLARSPVSDEIIEPLQRLSGLQRLDLRHTNVTNQALSLSRNGRVELDLSKCTRVTPLTDQECPPNIRTTGSGREWVDTGELDSDYSYIYDWQYHNPDIERLYASGACKTNRMYKKENWQDRCRPWVNFPEISNEADLLLLLSNMEPDRVTHLSLQRCIELTNETINAILGLPKLEALRLHEDVDDEFIMNLCDALKKAGRKLPFLNLEFCQQITDACVPSLIGLGLRELDLTRTAVTTKSINPESQLWYMPHLKVTSNPEFKALRDSRTCGLTLMS